MAAGTYNIKIEQGATFYRLFTVNNPTTESPFDYSGYTARMQIRREINSTGAPMLELTTSNGRITLGGAAGTIELNIAAADTAALTRDGVYDLELIDADGVVTRLLQGKVTLDKEVTRAT